MSDDKTAVTAWGYKPGEAKIFHLKAGEALPEGWSDVPQAAPEEPVAEEAEPKKRKRKSEPDGDNA